MSKGMMSDGDVMRFKLWVRRSEQLEDRITTGLLTVQNAFDRKLRLIYWTRAAGSFAMGDDVFTMGEMKHAGVIVSEYAIGVDCLDPFQPSEEVVVNGQPVGWQLLTHGVNGGLQEEMTFPSLLSAIMYVDITRTQ